MIYIPLDKVNNSFIKNLSFLYIIKNNILFNNLSDLISFN